MRKKIHWINWGKLCSPKNKGGMGFRDLNAFNLAMLTKQAQCLIQGTHSLFYRLYKAHYFPTCSFMDVDLGSNPSNVWQSLLQARELIKEGFAWQIGDGETVGVASHKWLPQSPILRPEVDQSLKVRSLFNSSTCQWDKALLHSVFTTSIRDAVIRIKLGNSGGRDKLCQMETKCKNFTVKFAYHFAVKMAKPPGGEHSLAGQDRKLWTKFWMLNTPPKVRNFIWRAFSNILPTKANLSVIKSKLI